MKTPAKRLARMSALVLTVAGFLAADPPTAAADLGDDCYQATLKDGGADAIIAVCSRAIASGLSGNRLSHAYNNRGLGYMRKGDLDSALSDFNEAIRIDPGVIHAYDNRGDVWRAKRQFDRAVREYNEVIRMDPTFISAYVNRGWAYEEMGNLISARADYEAVIAMSDKGRPIDNWAKRIARQRLDALLSKR